jgi:hypothetical protein
VCAARWSTWTPITKGKMPAGLMSHVHLFEGREGTTIGRRTTPPS